MKTLLETIYKLSEALGIELISFSQYKYSTIQRERSTTENGYTQVIASSIWDDLNGVSMDVVRGMDACVIADKNDNRLVSASAVEANLEGIAA